jgi:hypothetical protein
MTYKNSLVKVDRTIDLYIHFNGQLDEFIGVMTRQELLDSELVRPGAIDRADTYGSSVMEKRHRLGHWKDVGIYLKMRPIFMGAAGLLLLRRDFVQFAEHMRQGEEGRAKALLGRPDDGIPSEARAELISELTARGWDLSMAIRTAETVLAINARELADHIDARTGPREGEIQSSIEAAEICRQVSAALNPEARIQETA